VGLSTGVDGSGKSLPYRDLIPGPSGGEERCYRVLVETPEGKRPVGKPRRRWEDNIKMDLQAEGWRA
jgi:hypothetical protein